MKINVESDAERDKERVKRREGGKPLSPPPLTPFFVTSEGDVQTRASGLTLRDVHLN